MATVCLLQYHLHCLRKVRKMGSNEIAVGPAPKLALASNGQAGADTSPERSEWQHGVKFDIF